VRPAAGAAATMPARVVQGVVNGGFFQSPRILAASPPLQLARLFWGRVGGRAEGNAQEGGASTGTTALQSIRLPRGASMS
jgi:hypothetical protein